MKTVSDSRVYNLNPWASRTLAGRPAGKVVELSARILSRFILRTELGFDMSHLIRVRKRHDSEIKRHPRIDFFLFATTSDHSRRASQPTYRKKANQFHLPPISIQKTLVGSIKEPSSEQKFDGWGVEFCGNRTLLINRANGHESPSNDETPEKVFESMKCHHIWRTERDGHKWERYEHESVKFAETEGKQSVNQACRSTIKQRNFKEKIREHEVSNLVAIKAHGEGGPVGGGCWSHRGPDSSI